MGRRMKAEESDPPSQEYESSTILLPPFSCLHSQHNEELALLGERNLLPPSVETRASSESCPITKAIIPQVQGQPQIGALQDLPGIFGYPYNAAHEDLWKCSGRIAAAAPRAYLKLGMAQRGRVGYFESEAWSLLKSNCP